MPGPRTSASVVIAGNDRVFDCHFVAPVSIQDIVLALGQRVVGDPPS
jgi:hypothetical protein